MKYQTIIIRFIKELNYAEDSASLIIRYGDVYLSDLHKSLTSPEDELVPVEDLNSRVEKFFYDQDLLPFESPRGVFYDIGCLLFRNEKFHQRLQMIVYPDPGVFLYSWYQAFPRKTMGPEFYTMVEGLGIQFHSSFNEGGGITYVTDESLIWYHKGEEVWGIPLGSSMDIAANRLTVFPNPAAEFIILGEIRS